MKKTEVAAQRNIHARSIDIFLVEYEGQKVWMGKQVEMEEMSADEYNQRWGHPATMRLSYELATQLATELWQQGIRPIREVDPSGELSATQRHLNDMRTIVSKKLEIELG